MSNGKYLFDWKWSPTDPKGMSIAVVNGGSLTFLPNIGSVALFLLIALLYTLLVLIGRLLLRFKAGGKKGGALISKVTTNTTKLSSQWLRIFIEIFLMLYMYLLLGFEMAKQIEKKYRTPFDKWSIGTQSVLIVPILGMPILIMWFSIYHSRWFVSYHKVKFFLNY